jgi:hypothetical protein
MKNVLLMALIIMINISCKTSQKSNVPISDPDREIFGLITKLRQSPTDQASADLLSELYSQRIDYYRNSQKNFPDQLSMGDRYMQSAKNLEQPMKMYNEIRSTPAALRAVPYPWDPSNEIQQAKNMAAREYYNQGLNYLAYNNRTYSQKAYEQFQKADKAIPGYMDVKQKMNEAQRLSVLNVVVKPVNYYNNSFSYWGFQNDFLQTQMVRDLNFSSFRNTRFYTDWEATAQRIQIDKIVDLRFVSLNVSPVSSRTDTYQRSAEVQVGTTNSIPSKPVYQTVYATIYITTRSMYNNAALECRIYDRVNGANMFFDRFPGSYNWTTKTATFKGDRRALTSEDLYILNNSSLSTSPNRTEIANKLINECYNSLINRIRSAVQFY